MLSKKAQYALKALSLLAQHYGKGPQLISDIAQQKQIPLKFLEQILMELKKAGILQSKKGKGGGYFLDLPPEQTTLAAVIRSIDGPISLMPCASLYFHEKCVSCNERTCRIRKVFAETRDATLSVLESRTIADLF